jgi:hypothetical protein
MNDDTPGEAGYNPADNALLRDSRGNPIDVDYIDKVSQEAEAGYELDELTPARVGRPSLSDTGDSPQVRFRLPADTRAEAAALAAREGKTLSQLARDALEAYLSDRRTA